MPSDKKEASVYPHAAKLLYLLAIVLSFYFLYLSRSDEVYTIWAVIHPAFVPTFIAATFLLLAIIVSAERIEYKMLFTILHSILSHVLMVVVFPAGNVGVQQMMLGRTRVVFDNLIFHGFGWAEGNVLLKMYFLFRGENLQTAFSVIFARMLGVDVYWSHLLLVPLLWGIFVPIVAFMVSKTLGARENISVLSSLMVSAFPASILWGAVSIPNGLSYLFFFCFLYFLLKYLHSNEPKEFFLVLIFFTVSFLSHFLAGTIAFSLLLLANSVRIYEREKSNSSKTPKFMLLGAFIFCAGLLPFALIYRRFFYPTANTYFSFSKLYELPTIQAILSLLLGSYFDLISREAYITTLIFGMAHLVGLVGMIYALRASLRRASKTIDPCMLFLFLGFLMVIIDDRIVKFFMMNVPFVEFERLWLFIDFVLVSFTALVIGAALQKIRALFNTLLKYTIQFLRKKSLLRIFSRTFSFLAHGRLVNGVSLGSISAYILLFTIMSGWITASVYYAYPHWSPLQTTSYEIEAVKCIKQTTTQRYIVICDQWMIFAGQMFVGINNPQAFYFTSIDPRGAALFIKMKSNPSNETMIEAMKINNATIAYFIVEKPRLGPETYNRIVAQAQQNSLQTYQVFYLKGEEKLRIFHYRKTSPTEQ